jgi:predicted GIY-YIG superfamily endonuclease
VDNVGRYCVYLLAAGGRMAYVGFSGLIEERLRRHFRGYSSVAARGLKPDAAYVLACTRSRPLAHAWEAWLHNRPPYATRVSYTQLRLQTLPRRLGIFADPDSQILPYRGS